MNDAIEERILTESKTVAVVGMSPKPERPSHYVAKYLMEQGYRVIPVNPATKRILGLESYPSLKAVPLPIDVVNVFRRSAEAGAIVEDAMAVGAKFVWMQDGVIDERAAEKARAAGLGVVMDNCMLREHVARFGGGRVP